MCEADDFATEYAEARAGDRSAMDRLARRFGSALVGYVERNCGSDVRRRVAPADVAQDAMLTFLRRLPSYPTDLDAAALGGFLRKIARWRIADVLKRADLVVGESRAGGFEPRDSTPSRGPVTRADETHYLAGLIGRLREPNRVVMECVVLEAMSSAETATRLGLLEDTVRKRINRARRELGLLMKQR